jgi:uncharacterized membrane protein YjjB (DUF3815 family)
LLGRGSWLDVIFGTVVSLPTFVFMVLLLKHKLGHCCVSTIVTSFVCAIIAQASKYALQDLNVTLVVLSGVVIILPGYTVSLATAEINSNHVVAGASRLITGSLALLFLVVGGWLGALLVHAFGDHEAQVSSTHVESVPLAWQALKVFQNSRKDFDLGHLTTGGYLRHVLFLLPSHQ